MTVNTEYPDPDQKRACMRCIWWLARNSVVGQCRRMPPVRPDGEAAGFWPMTGHADWCGEYKENGVQPVFDPGLQDEIPGWVIENILQVNAWMDAHGHTAWSIGGIGPLPELPELPPAAR